MPSLIVNFEQSTNILGEQSIMSIENPTLAHFRHFSPLLTNLPSTSVENVLQISSFMQNKPNSPNVQLNVTFFITMNYTIFTSLTKVKNKPNSNPIKAKTKPIQTQLLQRTKLMQSVYLQRIMKKNADRCYEKTNPKQSQSNPISKSHCIFAFNGQNFKSGNNKTDSNQ